MSFYPAYHAVLGPASRWLFKAAGLFDEKIRRGLELRKPIEGRPAWKIPALESPVWIHCASGEFEYAKPVVTRLKAMGIPVLVSYFSPTYVESVRKFDGVSGVVPLPWDLASEMNDFIDHHRPRALLVARTDVWPEMARTTRERDVPSLLFSATLTSDSGRARGLGRWMARAVFSELREIWCVSDGDREVFESMGLHASVRGDTRFDQVRARLETPKAIRTELFSASPTPIFIAGSTWSEDEAVLSEAAKTFEGRIRFVFVPHEPTESHLSDLEERLKSKGLASSRYSKATSWTDGILIVDQMGILAELYLQGRFAFVGGSYRKTVHSVMEPLAAGCLTFLGPRHLNNREALELKTVSSIEGLNCVEIADDANALIRKLEEALRVDAGRLKTKIRSEIDARTGASDLVVKWVTDSCE